jgi:hypothetical protein
MGQVAIGDFVYQAQAPGGVINQIVVTDPIRALPRPVDVRPRLRRGQIERTTVLDGVTTAVGLEPVQIVARDGWGKTSVIAQLAYAADIERYRDGVAVISGWGIPIEDVEQAIFDAFYESTLPDTVHKVTAGQLRTSLGGVEAAIIVDDLDLPRQHIDRLIDACAGSGFISTASTQTLWSDGTVIDLEGLSDTAALTLFEQRLGRTIESTELEAATTFIAHVGGYPMAIVAAASAVRRGRTLIEMLPRLISAPDPIAAVHDELAATLSLAETRLLSILAAVKGDPLPPEAAGHAAGVDNASAILHGLTRDGLIEAASPRYRLPRSSSALLDLPVDGPATAKGLTSWCDIESDPALIVAAGPAIVAAIGSAAQAQDHGAAMALGRAADAALSLSGHWGIWGQVLEATRESASAAADPFVDAWALHQLGTRALAEQHDAQALELLGRAAEIRTQIGDQAGLEVTEHNLSLLTPAPATAPPGPTHPATPPSGGGIGWLAWTMIVVGLLAVAGIVGFVAMGRDPEPTVVTTIASQPGALVTPTRTIEIFDVPRGESVSAEVELINEGPGPVDINEVMIDGHGSMTVANSCSSLDPGESCLVSVAFSPREPGEMEAVVTVEHSGRNGTIQIPVLGVSIDPPEAFVTVDPASADFGVVALGEEATRLIEISNTGNLDAHVDDIRIDSGPFASERVPLGCGSLAPGDSCAIEVHFVAAQVGVFQGVLVVQHSGENTPSEIRLSGVVPEPANLTVEIIAVTDATTERNSDVLANGAAMLAITNIGQTATTDLFDYRLERLSPLDDNTWIPALTSEGNATKFTFRGSIGPGETVTVEHELGFPVSDYSPGSTTAIRAEVDSCFAEEFIEVPPCRVTESFEEDNVSEPREIRVFYEVIQ